MKNKERKIIVLVLITVFASTSLMAQVKVNTELKGFITQSFSYFPRIKEAENAIVTAEDRIALTQLNKSPLVNGDASYNYIRPKIVIPLGGADFQFAPVSSINTAVNASYMLFDFGKIKASIERSKDDLLYARHNVDNVKSKLAYQVANVYYNIVYLQKAISIQDSVLSFLNDNKQIVESKLKNGDALKIDLLNIQANIDNEGNRKIDLLNSLQKQYNLLDYTTGIKQSTGQLFDFDITLIDANAALGSAQSSNVDFLLARDKIKQSQSDLNIVKLGDKPSIDLHASSGVKNGYVPNINMMKFNYVAGVSLSVPIYNAGKTKQQIRLQQNLVKQNELAVESLSSDYKKDIDQSITDIKSNYERITNTQGQIEEAKYAQQLASIRFKNGVGTNLELTNSSTNEQRAELTKLQYEYQLCLAKVELARLMGYQYW